MLPTEIGSVVVALIAAGGAWASQRAASKASNVSTRMDAEKEAYERARKFDLETIERLKAENQGLRAEVTDLREQVEDCNTKITNLQDRFPISLQGLEGMLRDRDKEEHTSDSEQQDL